MGAGRGWLFDMQFHSPEANFSWSAVGNFLSAAAGLARSRSNRRAAPDHAMPRSESARLRFIAKQISSSWR